MQNYFALESNKHRTQVSKYKIMERNNKRGKFSHLHY